MDPEDVRRLLQPYHAQVRAELERFGGTVEKFIGDAVMAVFGAPIAHEDDPERAVRAALAIREALADEGELEVRIGITTGEALVALDARPDAGEGMASGDVVNTAARLQAAAPTERHPRRRDDLPRDRAGHRVRRAATESKPRARPSRSPSARRASRARSRSRSSEWAAAPLVGREQELTLLRETLARVAPRARAAARHARRRSRHRQEPARVRALPVRRDRRLRDRLLAARALAPVRGRRSRSGRSARSSRRRPGSSSPTAPEQAATSSDRPWSGSSPSTRTPPGSSGISAARGTRERRERAGDRRDEAFAAWRRFLEAIADERPLVLVFEDLHWADDALLDFVDHLVDWASGVPLLVLVHRTPGAAHAPAGLGRRQGQLVDDPRSRPLSEDETATLVHALLGAPAIDADAADAAPRARRRQPALRGGVRAHAQSSGRAIAVLPETRAGHHRRPARHAPRRGEGAAPGRRRDRQGLLARRARRRALDARGAAALARAQGVREARAPSLRRRRGRVRVPARARPRRRLRADPASASARTSTAPPPSGSSRSAVPTTTQRCSLTTTQQPSSYARAVGPGCRAARRAGTVALREAGDRAFALNAFRRLRATTSSPSSSGRTTIPAARAPSSARVGHISQSGMRGGSASLEDARAGPARRGGAVRAAAEADALLASLVVSRRAATRCDRAPRASVRPRPGAVRLARESPASLSAGLALPDARGTRTRTRFGSVRRRSPWRERARARRAARARARQHRNARDRTWVTPTRARGSRARVSRSPLAVRLARGRARATTISARYTAGLGDLRRATADRWRRGRSASGARRGHDRALQRAPLKLRLLLPARELGRGAPSDANEFARGVRGRRSRITTSAACASAGRASVLARGRCRRRARGHRRRSCVLARRRGDPQAACSGARAARPHLLVDAGRDEEARRARPRGRSRARGHALGAPRSRLRRRDARDAEELAGLRRRRPRTPGGRCDARPHSGRLRGAADDLRRDRRRRLDGDVAPDCALPSGSSRRSPARSRTSSSSERSRSTARSARPATSARARRSSSDVSEIPA